MAATFEFVGKLKKIEKETEKFKAFEEKRYDSGWTNQTFKFNAINGNNSHVMQIRAGFWSKKDGSVDDGKMKIYTQSKAEGGAKSQQMEVAFVDRANPDVLSVNSASTSTRPVKQKILRKTMSLFSKATL